MKNSSVEQVRITNKEWDQLLENMQRNTYIVGALLAFIAVLLALVVYLLWFKF